jgi:hypothetical protein
MKMFGKGIAMVLLGGCAASFGVVRGEEGGGPDADGQSKAAEVQTASLTLPQALARIKNTPTTPVDYVYDGVNYYYYTTCCVPPAPPEDQHWGFLVSDQFIEPQSCPEEFDESGEENAPRPDFKFVNEPSLHGRPGRVNFHPLVFRGIINPPLATDPPENPVAIAPYKDADGKIVKMRFIQGRFPELGEEKEFVLLRLNAGPNRRNDAAIKGGYIFVAVEALDDRHRYGAYRDPMQVELIPADAERSNRTDGSAEAGPLYLSEMHVKGFPDNGDRNTTLGGKDFKVQVFIVTLTGEFGFPGD